MVVVRGYRSGRYAFSGSRADAIPRSIPTSRRCLSTALPSPNQPAYLQLAAEGGEHHGHGPKETEPDNGSHSCASNGPDLTGPTHFLIRGIRGQASGGNQIHGAFPQNPTQRHPPDQPGCSCNPGTPSQSSTGVLT